MWVVKLGGSLQYFDGLRGWVELIANCGGGRLVLVPGGGRFADAVRDAQRESGLDDRTAHGMALFAMEQYGLELAGMVPGLVPAYSKLEIRAVLDEGRVPVWMPHAMAALNSDVPASWKFTSDSLALWLAGRLGADAVLLVKSVTVPSGAATADSLSQRGLVDGAFPVLARDYRGRIAWLERNEVPKLGEALAGGKLDGLSLVSRGKRETAPRAAARGAS